MLELYTHPMSPCAQKVRIVLAEKGLVWKNHHISLPDKENLTPEYLKLNPLGVVPTLVDNGSPIIESSIICEYLDDAYPQIPLRPENPLLISKIRFWMKHVDVKLHPSCGAIQWPLVMRDSLLKMTEEEQMALLDKVPEKPRRERQKRLMKLGLDAPDVAGAVKMYQKTIVDMEKALSEHQWLVGDEFSLADICMAPYFQTLYQFGWTAMYEKDFPNVTAWYARCRERDSYQASVLSDFSDEKLDVLLAKGKEAWSKIQAHLNSD
jgi:glutathione S-transferase